MKKKFIWVMAVICMSSLVSCSNMHDGDGVPKEHKNVSKEISIENLNEINIDIESSIINIDKNTGDKVEIKGNISEYSKDIDVDCKGGTLFISEESLHKGLNNNDSSEITITIPEIYNKALSFTYGAGESDIKNITVDKIKVNGGAGKCSISDVVFKNLDMKIGAGETDIDLDEECGNIDIEGGVGKFDLKLSKVGGNLTYKGGVGEANITIPENAPVDIKSGTGLGDFKQTAKTSGEGKYIFDVKTGIGSITIDN